MVSCMEGNAIDIARCNSLRSISSEPTTNRLIYIASFASMVLTARKIAVKCNSHHHQGISLSLCLKTWIDFEKACSMDRFCNSASKKRPTALRGGPFSFLWWEQGVRELTPRKARSWGSHPILHSKRHHRWRGLLHGKQLLAKRVGGYAAVSCPCQKIQSYRFDPSFRRAMLMRGQFYITTPQK